MVNARANEGSRLSALPGEDAAGLLTAAEEISKLRNLPGVMAAVRRQAREMMHADGVSFVIREGEQVFYADEDAIAPLWKGRRFPADACVSGWAIKHRQTVAIPDIYADPRVPIDAYRPTFVKGMLMVPIRVEDPVGAIGAYWATIHAATEREKLVLEALAGFAAVAVANAQLYQQACDAVRAREEWVGVAAHELRTPLTPMKLQLHSALRAVGRGASAPDLHDRLKRIDRTVDRLALLVESLLDYSSAAEGELALIAEEFDFLDLAKHVCSRFKDEARGTSLDVVLTAPLSARGRWDRIRSEQVLTILISNAIKYAGGHPVMVELRPHGSDLSFTVSDKGPGITPEDQERIFQPFMPRRNSGSGIGLGLWLVRKIVHAHGGTIEVTSAPGQGMKVAALLPSLRS